MAVLPTMDVPAGLQRKLATVWFAALVLAFVIYSTLSIVQAVHRWDEPSASVEYVAGDFPLPTLSLCALSFFDNPQHPPLTGITGSCWDTRNPNSKIRPRDFNVSDFPLPARRVNETITIGFGELPGDCEISPVYLPIDPFPGYSSYPGNSPYEFCIEFRTDKLPGMAQSLGKQPLTAPTTGIVRLTFTILWARQTGFILGFYLKSSAPTGFFGATEPTVHRSIGGVSGNSAEKGTPSFTVKTYLNGSKLLQQAWEVTSTRFDPNEEYFGQFPNNSVTYQLSLFPNALGVLSIKERSSVNVPVLLSQFASAWSAVILLFGLFFARQESRAFVLESLLASRSTSRSEKQGPLSDLCDQENAAPPDLHPV